MSEQINKEAIAKAHDILQDAQSKIEKILSGPGHGHLMLGVNAGIEKIKARLAFLSGVQQENPKSDSKFPPITEFMGEKIERPEPIEEDDLSPDELEEAQYAEKVNSLLANIDTIAPEGIIEEASLPEFAMVVRGVGKLLGIEDYETRKIDAKFINDLVAAKKQKQLDDDEQKRIEEELKKQEELVKQKQLDDDEQKNSDAAKKKGK